MASGSSAIYHSMPEAVHVLVSSLNDESFRVRRASMASLQDLAVMSPRTVLECCSAVFQGMLRFGNVANLSQVMAYAIRAMDDEVVDQSLMEKLAKMAADALIQSKEGGAHWQRAASSLLVSIGSHVPDLMMEEIFVHMSGPNIAVTSMVQTLADFSVAEASNFIPHFKSVLLRVLPVLGSVRDPQRPIFANAFKCWCQAACQYCKDFPCESVLNSDVLSCLNSAFELLLRVWVNSRDVKVIVSSVEALGQMAALVSRANLLGALPRLIPTIIGLYKKDQDYASVVACSSHSLVNATLLSETGPPLLDFEEVSVILLALLPVACINSTSDELDNFSVRQKTYNEVKHCFLTVGSVYPEELLLFLLNQCKSDEDSSATGALCVLRHLLSRFFVAWQAKQAQVIETIVILLNGRSLGIRKALVELIVVMAAHCYLFGSVGESFIEYLVRCCALCVEEREEIELKEWSWSGGMNQPRPPKKCELSAICERGLLLLAVTIPEMGSIMWPFLLKMIMPKAYTGAVAIVCRCIYELCRHKSNYSTSMFSECVARPDIPKPEELFARLVVLLHDPLARECFAIQILLVLRCLAPLFPANIGLFWRDEIPKMKAYVSDPDDLKQDLSYQDTWDDMIVNFLGESLDVIEDVEWLVSLGNAFSQQYDLYIGDHEHTAILHRCLGMLLQKVDNKVYVEEKMAWMYNHARISVPMNRLGLAKGIGLVAACHLDTVLEMLKKILDSVHFGRLQRFFSFFYGGSYKGDADDIHAALALMYGYAARYAPSTVIEARIDALVGTNMLSRLLHVHHPTAKQAVITAIDLLGQAVITAAENGISFPLKRRDVMLDYLLTLMGRCSNGDVDDDLSDFTEQMLHTQTLALNACSTLVLLEPRLNLETRLHVIKATFGLFALPADPSSITDPLIGNLIRLLCAIFLNSGEDGRSRAEQLSLLLRKTDKYSKSSLEHQRRRGCLAAYELLLRFQRICSNGSCGVHGLPTEGYRGLHMKQSNLPAAFVLPSRGSLNLGDRVIIYLPRCADSDPEIRKVAAQILDILFSVALSLPRQNASQHGRDMSELYNALGSLEDIIAIMKSETSIDQSEVFKRIISSVSILLTKDELVDLLSGCTPAICDQVKQSSEGVIHAVIDFISKRGSELNEVDVSRATESLLSAVVSVNDKHAREEVLGALCCLAENTISRIVFSGVLFAAGHDVMTKDISKLRGGWPIQDAFFAFSQHSGLSVLFLEHLLSLLNETPGPKGDGAEAVNLKFALEGSVEDTLHAYVLALDSLFRGGGKIGRRAVEQNYASVLCSFILHMGGYCFVHRSGHEVSFRALSDAFQSFCECVGDFEMGKILARCRVLQECEEWTDLVEELARCIFVKRPMVIERICFILCDALNRRWAFCGEASAAALSEFICYCDGVGAQLEKMVEVMCLSVADESPTTRCLCLRGLVKIPSKYRHQYTAQVLGVIVALLEDSDEFVQLTAMQCLLIVLSFNLKDAVDPILLSLCARIKIMQMNMNPKMRATAFESFGTLCSYSFSGQHEDFLEQVHSVLPRLILHIHDDDSCVRHACQVTFKKIASFLQMDSLAGLLGTASSNSDNRNDYEDFVRDVTKQLVHSFSSRCDSYLVSAIQAFDAPWDSIQANAIFFCSSLISLSGDVHGLSTAWTQAVSLLVGKMSQSENAVVRAASLSALGFLYKSADSILKRIPT